MQYQAIKLVKRPDTVITPDIFELATLETADLADGQILLKQTHMSLDPAMRGWMEEDRDSYMPPVEIGEIMRSSGVAEVVESNNPNFAVGSRVMGMLGWTEYLVSDGMGLNPLIEGLTAETALSVLAPGLAAYHGLINVGQIKSGQTLLISGAAGAVGSVAGQIAIAEGLTVVGTAGSDDKCRWLTEQLGFAHAVNYKSANLAAELDAALPNGIDVYFENTGGPVQVAAMNRMNAHGTMVVCGMIADYNTNSPAAGPNWLNIIKKRLTIKGFTMPDHYPEIPSMMTKLGEYLAAGRIQSRVHTLDGLESAIEGINLLFSGKNQGKLMVKL